MMAKTTNGAQNDATAQPLANLLAPLAPAAALAQVVAATPFVTTLPAGAALTLGACARLVAQTSPQAHHFRSAHGFWGGAPCLT